MINAPITRKLERDGTTDFNDYWSITYFHDEDGQIFDADIMLSEALYTHEDFEINYIDTLIDRAIISQNM
jgi:hypothetical protein